MCVGLYVCVSSYTIERQQSNTPAFIHKFLKEEAQEGNLSIDNLESIDFTLLYFVFCFYKTVKVIGQIWSGNQTLKKLLGLLEPQ